MAVLTVPAAAGGSFDAYCAVPASGHGPGVVVIQEIFGVNATMRGVTDALAAQGYLAACPDLFWRQKPGVQLDSNRDSDMKRAREFLAGLDQNKAVDDLKSSVAALRGHLACTGKVGTVGFCLGGRLAFLMAARSDAECNVSYYGVGIDGLLGEAKAIAHPLLLHVAGQDQYVPPEGQAKLRAAFKNDPRVVMHTYPARGHAFARKGGPNYDRESAQLADRRTAEFLHRALAA